MQMHFKNELYSHALPMMDIYHDFRTQAFVLHVCMTQEQQEISLSYPNRH